MIAARHRSPTSWSLAFALALLASAPLGAATLAEYAAGSYTDPTFGGMAYRYRLPAGYSAARRWPLVVWLHGQGEGGSDDIAQLGGAYDCYGALALATQGADPAILLAPQNPANPANWTDNLPWRSDLQKVKGIIDALSTQLAIDPDRIYLTGWSAGGEGAIAGIIKYPGVFAAAIPVAPAGFYADADVATITTIPLWDWHGVDQITSTSDTFIPQLRRLGGNPIYTRLTIATHSITPNAYGCPELATWMLAQRRGQRAAAAPWVAIASPTDGSATSDASIGATGSATNAALSAVSWTCGSTSGTAQGAPSWTIASIPLSGGANRIVVMATGSSYNGAAGGTTTFSNAVTVQRGAPSGPGPSTIRVDFGDGAMTTPGGWNNITAPSGAGSSVAGAVDANGVVTGVSIAMGPGFGWPTTQGVAASDLYPASAQQDCMPVLDGSAGTVTIAGLDDAKAYDLKLFASKRYNQTTVAYSAGGITALLDTYDNTGRFATLVGVRPSNGAIVLDVRPASGSAYAYLGVLELGLSAGAPPPPPPPAALTVLTDFGGGDQPTTAGGWNNITSPVVGGSGSFVAAAVDATGAPTGIRIAIGAGFDWANAQGVVASDLYPATAQRDSLPLASGASVGTVTISGLDATQAYDLTLFASEQWTPSSTAFSVTGGAAPVELVTYQNRASTVVIRVARPANGQAVLEVRRGAGQPKAFLGVVKLTLVTPTGTG